jgi:hypothetical protein
VRARCTGSGVRSSSSSTATMARCGGLGAEGSRTDSWPRSAGCAGSFRGCDDSLEGIGGTALAPTLARTRAVDLSVAPTLAPRALMPRQAVLGFSSAVPTLDSSCSSDDAAPSPKTSIVR